MIDRKNIIKEIKNWTFSILAAFFIFILLNSKVYAKVQVQQKSMENTLYSNQQLIIDKLSYNFTKPKRGDIIIFLENEEKGTLVDDMVSFAGGIISIFNKDGSISLGKDNRLVKRVIGVSGDEVDIRDGYVYLNGKMLDEPYVKGKTSSGELEFPVKVGENKLFVLGDNRPVSKDSRKFGLIDCGQVEGKAILRVYPFSEAGLVR